MSLFVWPESVAAYDFKHKCGSLDHKERGRDKDRESSVFQHQTISLI